MGKKVVRFEDLEIWIAAMAIAKDIYLKTSSIKDYYIRDQINRAALSISNNIAEGFEYNNDAEFLRFLKYAKGSCGEVRSILFFLKETGLMNVEDCKMFTVQAESISKQIMGLMKYIRANRKENKGNVTVL